MPQENAASGPQSVDEIREMVQQAAKQDSNKKKVLIAVAILLLIAFIAIAFVIFQPAQPVPPAPHELCENGLQDAGEDGVDCGGNCEQPCVPDFIQYFAVKPASVTDVAVNEAAGRIYVVDEARHYVMIYDLELNHILNIGEIGDEETYKSGSKEKGALFIPAAIALDSQGNVHILDRDKRVQKFSSEGEFISETRFEANILETFPKMEDAPHIDGAGISMALANNGKYYISDELSSIVAVFSSDLKLEKAIGGRGSGNEQLVFPGQITLQGDKVYVADSGNGRVQIFDLELNYFHSLTGPLKRPYALDVDKAGNIYVLDAWDSKLRVFGESYALKEETGGLGMEIEMFYNPSSIKIASSGKIYIAEQGTVRVQILGADLKNVNTIDGIFGGSVTGFPVFYVAVAPDGRIAVSEPTNNRVSVFSSTGRHIKSIGKMGFGNEEFNMPKGVAFDSQNRLFVGDSWNHRIQVFSKDLEYVTSITHPELYWPVEVEVADDGRIYVAEDTSKKVLMFDKLGEFIGEISASNGITLPLGILAEGDRLYITDDLEKTIEVFDKDLVPIESIGGIDEGTGAHVEFNESLALDSQGRIMFCDNRNRAVVVYDFGTKQFSTFGDFGASADELSVLEIDISEDKKTIVVSDLYNKMVVLFDGTGKQIGEITVENIPIYS